MFAAVVSGPGNNHQTINHQPPTTQARIQEHKCLVGFIQPLLVTLCVSDTSQKAKMLFLTANEKSICGSNNTLNCVLRKEKVNEHFCNTNTISAIGHARISVCFVDSLDKRNQPKSLTKISLEIRQSRPFERINWLQGFWVEKWYLAWSSGIGSFPQTGPQSVDPTEFSWHKNVSFQALPKFIKMKPSPPGGNWDCFQPLRFFCCIGAL